MRTFAIVAALAVATAVGACSKPTITGANRDHVVIKTDTWMNSAETIAAKAGEECARHGRVAVLVESSADGPIGQRQFTRFDCVDAAEAE